LTRVRIKMCGTTRAEDAACAVNLGIDALGFIFAEKSPRCVTPEQAAILIAALPPFVSRVGVFVNESLDTIESVAGTAGLTAIQLHGHESPEFCRELKKRQRALSVCKAFSIGKEHELPAIAGYTDTVDAVLLDTYAKGQGGGTGKTFDWGCIEELGIAVPLILAGGLNPENIEKAVRMVRPFAVDINSGVEDAPGIKNHRLLADLVGRVRQLETKTAK